MRRVFLLWIRKMSNRLAIIGGSVLPRLKDFEIAQELAMDTPFGPLASPLQLGKFANKEIVFLNRHGAIRNTPPHLINYQANIWALKQLSVDKLIGISIVGGIRSDMTPGYFVFPDQLIDYTYGRTNSFFLDDFSVDKHIDFTHPYCHELRNAFIQAAQALHLNYSDDATYGVTQGPRFETVAEINRLERDGCDVVGMTAMPEAILARELDMRYASIAIVGSKAAGRTDGLGITVEAIRSVVEQSLEKMRALLYQVVESLPS